MAGSRDRQYQAVLYYNERPKISKVRSKLGTVLDFTEFATGEDFQQIYLSSVIQRSYGKNWFRQGCMFRVFRGNQFLRVDRLEGIAGAENESGFISVSALRNVPFCLENLLESELLVVLAFAAAQCIYTGGGRAYFRN